MEPCKKCGAVHPGCTGHTKNGDRAGLPCARSCHPGEVCHVHGGAARQVKAARARRKEEAKAAAVVATLGLPIDITPTEALLQEVQWAAGHVHWLRDKVRELDSTGGQPELVWGTTKITTGDANAETQEAKPSIWYDLYERERKHLVTVCTAALKAGVEERRVRLAESQGDLVATAITRILDALHLTPEQLALVPDVVPTQLRLIAGGHA